MRHSTQNPFPVRFTGNKRGFTAAGLALTMVPAVVLAATAHAAEKPVSMVRDGGKITVTATNTTADTLTRCVGDVLQPGNYPDSFSLDNATIVPGGTSSFKFSIVEVDTTYVASITCGSTVIGKDSLYVASPTPTPTPTPTPSATASPTPSATASPTVPVTVEPTATASPTPSATASATASPTVPVTVEPTATATASPTATVNTPAKTVKTVKAKSVKPSKPDKPRERGDDLPGVPGQGTPQVVPGYLRKEGDEG